MIGKSSDIESYLFPVRFINTYINAFVAFVFLIMSMYHLLIYLKRKKDVENLYYSLSVFFYALYCTNFFSDFFYSYLGISYLTFQQIIILISSGMMYYMGRFFASFFKMPFPKVFQILYLVSVLLPGILNLFMPDYGLLKKYRGLTTLLQFLPTLIYIVYCVVRGLLHKKSEAKAMVFGLIPLFVVSIHDVALVIFNFQGSVFLAGLGVPWIMGSIVMLYSSEGEILLKSKMKQMN